MPDHGNRVGDTHLMLVPDVTVDGTYCVDTQPLIDTGCRVGFAVVSAQVQGFQVVFQHSTDDSTAVSPQIPLGSIATMDTVVAKLAVGAANLDVVRVGHTLFLRAYHPSATTAPTLYTTNWQVPGVASMMSATFTGVGGNGTIVFGGGGGSNTGTVVYSSGAATVMGGAGGAGGAPKADYIDYPQLPRSQAQDPIRAQKSAKLVWDQNRIRFMGMGVAEPYDAIQDAICYSDRAASHPTPDPSGTCKRCGFYALKDLKDSSYDTVFTLDVDLYGTVIEHRLGYRAAHQRVLKVTVQSRCYASTCRRPVVGLGMVNNSSTGVTEARPTCSEHTPPFATLTLAQVAEYLGTEVEWGEMPKPPPNGEDDAMLFL